PSLKGEPAEGLDPALAAASGAGVRTAPGGLDGLLEAEGGRFGRGAAPAGHSREGPGTPTFPNPGLCTRRLWWRSLAPSIRRLDWNSPGRCIDSSRGESDREDDRRRLQNPPVQGDVRRLTLASA